MFSGTTVCIPKSLVLATGVFSVFMQSEGLYKIALDEEISDEEITRSFSHASLPTVCDFKNLFTLLSSFFQYFYAVHANIVQDVVGLLRVFMVKSSCPLAVRSSSVFEDVRTLYIYYKLQYIPYYNTSR
jgi:hypothetical protein